MRTRNRLALLKCVLSCGVLWIRAQGVTQDAVITMSCGALANSCAPTDSIKVVATIAVAADPTPDVKAAAQGNAEKLPEVADYRIFDRDSDMKKLALPKPLPTNTPGERTVDLRRLLASQSDDTTLA